MGTGAPDQGRRKTGTRKPIVSFPSAEHFEVVGQFSAAVACAGKAIRSRRAWPAHPGAPWTGYGSPLVCLDGSQMHEPGKRAPRNSKPSSKWTFQDSASGVVTREDLSERIDARDIGSGTPVYTAPEHLAGEQVSVSSDIYALGLVLYEMFGGRHPLKDISEDDLLKVKRSLKPATIHLRADVDGDIVVGSRHSRHLRSATGVLALRYTLIGWPTRSASGREGRAWIR